MISSVLFAIERALGYISSRPQIIFGLLLLIVLPLAFWYSSTQFIAAGQTNTNTMVYQRIGLLNDVFASLVIATDVNTAVLQEQIQNTAELNGDITKFRVVVPVENELRVVAAINQDLIGTVATERELYEKSFSEPTGISFPFQQGSVSFIQSFRAVKDDSFLRAYIFIESDQTSINAVFKAREQNAYVSLVVLYIILLGLVFWLFRLTNYRRLYQEANEAIKTKDMFTNMIAHELRAPLTAINGYAGLGREIDDVNKQNEYFEKIELSAKRLITIVNDLLDVARLQSGKLKVELKTVDAQALVQTVVSEMNISAQQKDIKLAVAEGAALYTTADTDRLHQVLTNLVSNAIKYTENGEISIKLFDRGDEVEIRVQDTGMGISAADQKELFAPFFRVASDDVSQITGTGLGMWITRQFVELMGGTVGVESIKGVGTHVVVKLEAAASKE